MRRVKCQEHIFKEKGNLDEGESRVSAAKRFKIGKTTPDLLRNNKERFRVEGMSREGLIKKHASDSQYNIKPHIIFLLKIPIDVR